ncbi:unnamed protein product [Ectocarpus sp. CCAP 1310/34]|nr:unnamed protein product [Ectocarpus sp. CCAP 1310/34]
MNPHQRASAMIRITIVIAGMMISVGGPQVVAAQQDFDASSYARNVSLDPNVDVFWTVDANLGTIKAIVHAKAATGWAGLGVSEMGGMEGGDIVYYETGVRGRQTQFTGSGEAGLCTEKIVLTDIQSHRSVAFPPRISRTAPFRDIQEINNTRVHLGTGPLGGYRRGRISMWRYSFRRIPVLRFPAVPPLASPGPANNGGIFLAVLKYDGTAFGGSRFC